LGRQTSINPGRTAAGGTIFRVWIGPYDSENTAEETRAQLVLQGYNSVQLLKLVNNEN
jgi:cell division protein FtsN